MIEGGLVQRPDGDQVVALENGIPGVQDLCLGDGIGEDGEARVLAKGGGEGEAKEAAVEGDGRGERGGDLEERGEGKERDGASVAIGHDAPRRAVVGDAVVAELHRLGRDSDAVGLVGRRRTGVIWDVQVEEPHCPR